MIFKKIQKSFWNKQKVQYEIIPNIANMGSENLKLEKPYIHCKFLSKTFHFFHIHNNIHAVCIAKILVHSKHSMIYYFAHIILLFSGKQKLIYCLLLHDNSEIKHSANSIVPILSLWPGKKTLPIQNLLICYAARNSLDRKKLNSLFSFKFK